MNFPVPTEAAEQYQSEIVSQYDVGSVQRSGNRVVVAFGEEIDFETKLRITDVAHDLAEDPAVEVGTTFLTVTF